MKVPVSVLGQKQEVFKLARLGPKLAQARPPYLDYRVLDTFHRAP